MLRSHMTELKCPQASGLPRRSMTVICLSILLIAVGVRLLQWQNNWLTIDNNMSRLTARYKEEAQFLLNGDILSFARGSTVGADATALMHPPGYPILIALIYKIFGHSDIALRAFQILADSGAAILVFLITAKLLPRGVAIIAGLLVASSPQLAYHSLLLLPDSLSGLPILLAIYLIARTGKHSSII